VTFIVTLTFAEFKSGQTLKQWLEMCLCGPSLVDSPQSFPTMHICDEHEELLPDGVRPMLMPDTEEEAGLLLCLLENGCYPGEAFFELELPTDPDRHDSSPGARILRALAARLRNQSGSPESASEVAGTLDRPE